MTIQIATCEPALQVQSLSRPPKPSENRSSITVRKASRGPRVPARQMALRKRGLIAAGLILLLIGGYTLYNYNPVHAYQSTFNLLPGKFFKIGANLRDQTRITGTFQETAGRPVEFMVMSSAQFAAFQTRTGTASLYSLPETATGQVDFTSSVPDTYYMLFLHGTGYLNVTQTVNFQRTYTSADVLAIVAGPPSSSWAQSKSIGDSARQGPDQTRRP